MNNKEYFDFLAKGGVKLNDLDYVRSKVQCILWGSLNVILVTKIEGGYQVDIGGTAPGKCPELCDYIEKHLHAWGWEVSVINMKD
jgi:hypothetical protein